MTGTAIAPAPRPKRALGQKLAWQPGDLVQLGSARWITQIIDATSGHVELESSNAVNSSWWTTTVDKLPDPPRASS